MIQAIGLMIAAYIITKMLSLLIDKKDTGIIVTILAAITISVTVYCIYVLLTSGIDTSDLLRYST